MMHSTRVQSVPVGVERPHHAGVPPSDRLVVVVHQQPMVAVGAGAGAAGPHVPKVPLEPGDDLLERLFS